MSYWAALRWLTKNQNKLNPNRCHYPLITYLNLIDILLCLFLNFLHIGVNNFVASKCYFPTFDKDFFVDKLSRSLFIFEAGLISEVIFNLVQSLKQWTKSIKKSLFKKHFLIVMSVHRGAFCQFPLRWIYYCHSSKSTGKEIGKTHLCAVR